MSIAMEVATARARSRVTIAFKASLVLGVVSIISLAITTVRIAKGSVPEIPYVTPVVNYMTWIFSPLIPFKAAFFIAIFIKLYRHAPFPTKGTTCFTAFGWALSQSEHPIIGIVRLFGDGKNFTNEVCSLTECKGLWFEWGLILVVVVASWRGWRLTGLTDRVVEGIVSDLWGGDEPLVEHMETVVVVDEKTVMIDNLAVDMKAGLATEILEEKV